MPALDNCHGHAIFFIDDLQTKSLVEKLKFDPTMGYSFENRSTIEHVLGNNLKSVFVVDMKYRSARPEQVVEALYRHNPGIGGRVLLISGDRLNRRMRTLIQHYSLSGYILHADLNQDLAPRIHSLINSALQNRRVERVRTRLPVIYGLNKLLEQKAYCTSFSRHGMFIETLQICDQLACVYVEMTVPLLGRVAYFTGRVIYTTSFGFAIQFDDDAEELLEHIKKNSDSS